MHLLSHVQAALALARIVNVANASKVLNCSFITYSNDAKINMVDVNPDTLDCYGAVSEEVVKEMASGAAKAANSEIGVGISGIAGPFRWLKRKTNRHGLLWDTNKQ